MPFAAVLGFLPPFCLTLLSGSGFSRVQVNQKKLQHSKRQKINCRRFGEDSVPPCGLVRQRPLSCTEPPRRAVWYGRGCFSVRNLPAVLFGTAEAAFLYRTDLYFGRSSGEAGPERCGREGEAGETWLERLDGVAGRRLSPIIRITKADIKCQVPLPSQAAAL